MPYTALEYFTDGKSHLMEGASKKFVLIKLLSLAAILMYTHCPCGYSMEENCIPSTMC
jgi:hypothetical protein